MLQQTDTKLKTIVGRDWGTPYRPLAFYSQSRAGYLLYHRTWEHLPLRTRSWQQERDLWDLWKTGWAVRGTAAAFWKARPASTDPPRPPALAWHWEHSTQQNTPSPYLKTLRDLERNVLRVAVQRLEVPVGRGHDAALSQDTHDEAEQSAHVYWRACREAYGRHDTPPRWPRDSADAPRTRGRRAAARWPRSSSHVEGARSGRDPSTTAPQGALRPSFVQRSAATETTPRLDAEDGQGWAAAAWSGETLPGRREHRRSADSRRRGSRNRCVEWVREPRDRRAKHRRRRARSRESRRGEGRTGSRGGGGRDSGQTPRPLASPHGSPAGPVWETSRTTTSRTEETHSKGSRLQRLPFASSTDWSEGSWRMYCTSLRKNERKAQQAASRERRGVARLIWKRVRHPCGHLKVGDADLSSGTWQGGKYRPSTIIGILWTIWWRESLSCSATYVLF